MAIKNVRTEASVLVSVVFLLGLLLGDTGSHLWDERALGQQPVNTKPTRLLDELTRSLQLTADQQVKVASAIDDTRARWQALYAPLYAPREQIRQQERANIRALLPPDQQPKFDAMMKLLDEQRKKEATASH